MSADSSLAKELREAFSNTGRIVKERFTLLQELSRFVSLNEYEAESQELILRALEHREEFAECGPILDSLVRQVGLFPYLNPNSLSVADQIAYEFHRPNNMGDDIVFHRPQARIYRMLLDGENVALSAPTSFGKSLIIDAAIASGHYKNIVIIVPTIALIDETRRRLTKRFRGEFKVITHTSQVPTDKNIFVLTQERALEFGDFDNIDFFVIDEFYKLSPNRDDDDRSYLLNQAFYKLVKKGRQFYMLGPNILGISQEFQKRVECKFLNEPYHTVVSELRRVPKSEGDELQALAELCKQLKEPTIIFYSSPNRARIVAEKLAELRLVNVSNQIASASRWITENYDARWHFVKALQNGIGIHHGRIPRSLAQYAVRKFNDGSLRFLVCTSTLIEGINTSAKNIIIFDNKINRNQIDLFTFNNIRGRSGRMFKYFIGYVYIFHEPPETELPFVDIPAFSQSEKSPESLLIQIDDDDLTQKSQERLRKYTDQEIIGYDTLKQNIGIDLDTQLELAREISNSPEKYQPLLTWSQYPTYHQLNCACQLIWNFFNGLRLGAGSIRTADHLTFSINRLQNIPATRELIKSQIEYLRNTNTGEADDAVQQTIDFIRLWATFNFPRLLHTLDLIQRDVFGRLGLPSGNYDFYANQVENLFLDPAIIALDEYGIPLELARKLQSEIRPDGDLDIALQALKEFELDALKLSDFEIELLKNAIEYI